MATSNSSTTGANANRGTDNADPAQAGSTSAVAAADPASTPTAESTADIATGSAASAGASGGDQLADASDDASNGGLAPDAAEAVDSSTRATSSTDVRGFTFPDLSVPDRYNVDPARVSMLSDVNLNVRIELGRTRMLVEEVLKLDEGSVVELDKLAGDPVDVYVNDRLVARGEVLVLNDNFCVRVGDVFSHDPHRVLK